MSTYIETNCVAKVNRDSWYRQRANTELDTGKRKWLRKYSRRLLRIWLQRQTPLGVTPVYIGQIEKDLARFYDDPLKRRFVETTYY
ncbi:MAG: hypothetical protein AMJ65_09360 [Phycisphaerae bacterium SG8_4]|nr:MAG: hypothetical protein AMJ65_09360 [Phycisphaerae bacterium SG8_4]